MPIVRGVFKQESKREVLPPLPVMNEISVEQLRLAEAQLYPPLVQGSRQPDFHDGGVPWTSNNQGGGLSDEHGIHNGSDYLPLTGDNFNAVVTHLRAADEVLKNRVKELEKKQMHLEAIVKALTGGRIAGA